MAIKRIIFILGLTILTQGFLLAQNDAGYNWRDSSKISTKNMPQHNEFMNNEYPYPAKPNSQLELGFSGGFSRILGDISPQMGYTAGISLRKALGHTFSVRAGVSGAVNKGIDYRPRNSSGIQTGIWTQFYPGSTPFVANFKNRMLQGSLDLIASLNTKSHYRGNPKWDVYGLMGYTFSMVDVDVDALKGNTPYNFGSIDFSKSRKDIRSALKNLLDGTYENNADVVNGNRSPIGRYRNNVLQRHGVSVGFGAAYKLSDKVNLGVEQKFINMWDDNLDGVNTTTRGNDIQSTTSVRLNFNIGNTSKKVAPLWWINPNNYVYNEINKPQHMKMPKVVLPDADGDGVTDQFDLEPNTPAGAPVDNHGRAKDSDGDGVPDYKDKELLTSQKCFPVNTDGVGTCPEPSCCKELRDEIKNLQVAPKVECNLSSLPSVQFKSGNAKLNNDAMAVLASAASQIKNNPNCNVKVIGYGATDKRSQQLSWDRVNAVITYLVEKQGVSQDRFIFTYGQGSGENNTVDLQATLDEGPNTIPAPHPNLKKG